jgi:hypothetical protein
VRPNVVQSGMDEFGEVDPSDSRIRGLSLGFGLGALSLALVAALYAVGIDGQPHDATLIFNGHHVGGPGERMVAGIIAVALGALGVFCVLRFRRSVD